MSEWVCNYEMAKSATALFGRATRLAWEKSNPNQYVYVSKPFSSLAERMIHYNGDAETRYQPSKADKMAKDWIVFMH